MPGKDPELRPNLPLVSGDSSSSERRCSQLFFTRVAHGRNSSVPHGKKDVGRNSYPAFRRVSNYSESGPRRNTAQCAKPPPLAAQLSSTHSSPTQIACPARCILARASARVGCASRTTVEARGHGHRAPARPPLRHECTRAPRSHASTTTAHRPRPALAFRSGRTLARRAPVVRHNGGRAPVRPDQRRAGGEQLHVDLRAGLHAVVHGERDGGVRGGGGAV